MTALRISRIEVKNFKSLVDFQIDLPKFSCLIGLNGAGKSTVLQFIDFLSQLVRGDMQDWLAERKWKWEDLRSKLVLKSEIKFNISFCNDLGEPAGRWEVVYSPETNYCLTETILLSGFELKLDNGDLNVKCIKEEVRNGWEDWDDHVRFGFEGSVLSAVKDEFLPPSILYFKKCVAEIKSLDLLAPEYLRQRTRESSGTLGLGGQNLASFIYEMDEAKRQELTRLLQKAYPSLRGLNSRSLQAGWKQLEVTEECEQVEGQIIPWITTEARHVNDGMLRLIAILAELQSENRFLLFDEIENGINPELVEFVVTLLVEAKQQVMVTTHSPMILNYLEDEVAKEGVLYLYKTNRGYTKAIRFFSIPSLQKKLAVMGPGEAFVDTSLTELADEIAGMSKEEK